MNKTMKKCVMAEQVCEVLIGGASAIILNKTVTPKCNGLETIVVTLGSGVLGWMVGRGFAKKFYKFCDDTFDTEFEDGGYLDAL